MEMIDEKGYEKKTPDKILPIISVIFITILMVEFYMMEDFSLIIKLLYSIFIVWIFIYDFRKKIYCLFNYEEFHYYEIDRFRKKIKIHIYAKWKDIKYIECDGGTAFSNPTRIKFKNSTKLHSYDYTLLYQFRKDIKKYSKRDDIIYRYKYKYKSQPFEKGW